MVIRDAQIDDAAGIERLISQLGYARSAADVIAAWPDWTAEGNSAVVAEQASSLVGMITLHRMMVLHRPQPVGRITSLVVDEAVRGQGIGRKLVAAAQHTLAAAGCGLVEVTSHTRLTEAHAFYRHLSFEMTSYRFAMTLRQPTCTADHHEHT